MKTSFVCNKVSLGLKVGFMSTAAESGRTHPIGEIARRFGLAASTLRWWEKCGLLAPSAREAGRRRYDEGDVRRIALIQMWQASAMMSLDEIGALLTGSTQDRDWRSVVRRRIATCDEQLERLATARAHLAHMLECPSEHPVDTCPDLAARIDEHLAARDAGHA